MRQYITVGLSQKAFEIAKDVDKKRKEQGLSSSLSAVTSEAVIKTFSKEKVQ